MSGYIKRRKHCPDDDIDWDDCFDLDDIDQTEFDEFPSRKNTMLPAATAVLGECAICLESTELVLFMKKCKQHSRACKACLRDMYVIQAQQDVGSYPLRCFHPSCDRPVPYSLLEQRGLFQSDKEVAKHYRFVALAKAYVSGSKKVYHCPTCDHPSPFKPASSWHVTDRSIKCRSCRKTFIVQVREDNTSLSETIAAVEAIQPDKTGRNDGWARCPKCKMIISKGNGCTSMYCPCGHTFNWKVAVEATDRAINEVDPGIVKATSLS